MYLSVILGSMFCIIGCKDSYTPDILKVQTSYLVIEGILNTNGPTLITLTRTTELNNNNTNIEAGAVVSVENETNNSIQFLNYTNNGIYYSSNLNLENGKRYRVRIITGIGREYLSEYVVAKTSPQIDSISWIRKDDGVEIEVSTHDLTNRHKFYKWWYEETWEIRSFFNSRQVFVGNGVVRPRNANEMVDVGWKVNSSKSIHLATSAGLEQEVINKKPLLFIEPGSEKLAERYSILVKQQVLEEDAYNFFQVMKKNTESLGTIFDPLPSDLAGNIKCVTNPLEPVIGFITASSITEKRIFIDKQELPDWKFTQSCVLDRITNDPDSLNHAFTGAEYIPLDAILSEIFPGVIAAYSMTTAKCADCTKRGGGTVKPTFW